MCECNDKSGLRNKLVATFAGFASIAAVFTTTATATLTPSVAEAHTVRTTRHLFRPTAIPTGLPGQYKVGLWILNPADGRVRLCLIDDPEADKTGFLKCSAWQGGGAQEGRYSIMDIGRRLPSLLRRRPGAMPNQFVAGVWVFNSTTGEAQACVVTSADDPTGSLRCSKG